MLRIALTAAVIAAGALTAPASAQDQTLADIKQELSVLVVQMQRLKRELSTTGGAQVSLSGTSALDRINAIEAELTRLPASTEALTNRIDRIVADGTNQIGDIQFRLCELEAGCDIGALPDVMTLGGESATAVSTLPAPTAAAPTAPTAELAIGEQADFDQAKASFDGGAFEDASIQFLTFTESYPGSPLSGQAHFFRGEALAAIGNQTGAARAYLESFSGDPNGTIAPDALLRLGTSLNDLGQVDEGCLMLDQVTQRFPSSSASIEAQTARASLGCV